jgi:DNA-binding CsgD family transcriptional regulator
MLIWQDSTVVDTVEQGEADLRAGRWEEARRHFESALDRSRIPEALDGLGRSLWWLGEAEEAIALRRQAYTAFRRAGRFEDAARVAIWISLEMSATPGSESVARGWMRRAEGLLADDAQSPLHGWLALARSGVETDPVRMADLGDSARQSAVHHGDADLEVRSLARLGLALVWSGRSDEGMAYLDEAMAAASAGESENPETFAQTCCDMVAACEMTLDGRRLEQWGQVAERYLELRPDGRLISFCGTCCAGVLQARGHVAAAEKWLQWTIDKMVEAGHGARCVDPRAKLAQIRVDQGRWEEAERLLAGIETRPEALSAMVALERARGRTNVASALLYRRLAKVGRDSVGAIPILAEMVPVQIERGDLPGAARSVEDLTRLAGHTGDDRRLAEAELARGRLLAATGSTSEAVESLRSAVERLDRLRVPLDAAYARLDLARALADQDPDMAVVELRLAASAFSEAGAGRQADEADAMLRAFGERGRVGPKGSSPLTRREEEVLALLAEGLTNAEIADRLFISVKTAGNHVSNVLTKLQLKNRSGVAAFAVRTARA